MDLVILLRLFLIALCASSVLIMLVGFFRFHTDWNEKTRDYWFGRVMWCIAAISSSSEAIVRHSSFRYSIGFFIVAGLVTLKGVLQRGSWGTSTDAVNKNTKFKRRGQNKKYVG
jgi:multisubunit Na+/H+ antiporter MnhG subunit